MLLTSIPGGSVGKESSCSMSPALANDSFIPLAPPGVPQSHICMLAKSLQWWLTLCDPMGCSSPGPLSIGFSGQEYWSGLSSPSPEKAIYTAFYN